MWWDAPWDFCSAEKRSPPVTPQRSGHGTPLELLPFFVSFLNCGDQSWTHSDHHSGCSLLANFLPILQTTHPVCILPACPTGAVCLNCNFRMIFHLFIESTIVGTAMWYLSPVLWSEKVHSSIYFLGHKPLSICSVCFYFFNVCFYQYWNS